MYNENLDKEFYDIVQINGSLSVATQNPWIINGTVKENIIFG